MNRASILSACLSQATRSIIPLPTTIHRKVGERTGEWILWLCLLPVLAQRKPLTSQLERFKSRTKQNDNVRHSDLAVRLSLLMDKGYFGSVP